MIFIKYGYHLVTKTNGTFSDYHSYQLNLKNKLMCSVTCIYNVQKCIHDCLFNSNDFSTLGCVCPVNIEILNKERDY